LREAEVVLSQGATVAQASRKIGITEQHYCRRGYNHFRPHSALHYQPQAHEAILVEALT